MRRLSAAITWLFLGLFGPLATLAAQPAATPTELDFFEKTIRPLLAQHCYSCHGPSKQRAGLRLDTQAGFRKGSDSGPLVDANHPEQSLILKAVSYQHDELKMPPKGKLSDKAIAELARWVKSGAAFPAPAPGSVRADAAFWAFRPLAVPAPPAVRDCSWPRSSIDQFILARMESAGLTPAPAADKRTLIRRATFDLTGLPPTPDEIDSFLADQSPAAFARVVDRLLASPAYGERWGRHWLDVARYADSNGLDENVAHGNAWRYRDYVIASFNRDKPCDQFLVEQLAGDLLDSSEPSARNERLIATGFLALGPKVLAEVDEKKMEMDIVDEQIDTVGRAMLGLTLGCARCHDHKFDPISTEDYYGLAGIFTSTKTMDSFTKIARWHENPVGGPADLARKAAHDAQVAQIQAAIQDLTTRANVQLRASLGNGASFPKDPEPMYAAKTRGDLKNLRDGLAAFQKSAPEMPTAMGVADGKTHDSAVNVRGSHLKLGKVVPRRFPQVLAGSDPPAIASQHSGRLELARWLTRPDHPLTRRVLVNRVWRWHFGQGLVHSTDNFGKLGDLPTHPELLDWLARRFIDDGWSLKSLHRRILLSNVYQLSHAASAHDRQADPENRFYSRRDPRRLEAEAIRDSLLAVSGALARTPGGPVLHVKNRQYLFDHTSKDLTRYDSRRRSVYLPVIRNNLFDVFQLFDVTDPAVPGGDRATTTIAPQALFMMNSDLATEASQRLAANLLAGNVPAASRVQDLYIRAYGRPATEQEVARGTRLVENATQALAATEPARSNLIAWQLLCQTVLAANEFIFVE